jgi:hypothetical protein
LIFASDELQALGGAAAPVAGSPGFTLRRRGFGDLASYRNGWRARLTGCLKAA